MLHKTRLELKLHEIAKILESKHIESNHLGVLSGLSGISMFFFHYARYTQNNKYAVLANHILAECINKISEGYSFPTYCTGIAGMGWVFEHLAENGFIDVDNDELLQPLDETLFHNMIKELETGHYDFLHGAIGYGVYFLKRHQNAKSLNLKKKYSEYLNRLLEDLEKIAHRDNDGLKWISEVVKDEKTTLIYNLSLSHGASSIISFLARVHRNEAFTKSTDKLLEESVAYLLAQENAFGQSLFPSVVPADSPLVPSESRLSWCYGDLGIGISLYQAAEALNNSSIRDTAIRVLSQSSYRRGAKSCGVIDASPCHGAFGIAIIYGNLNKRINSPELASACEYWTKAGLEFDVYEDGYAGYKQQKWRTGPSNEVNILEGVAGIGLSIISYLSGFKTQWEECLLIK